MLERYYPNAYGADVFSIDYEKLYAKGFKAILFDVDNTLVHHNDDATPEIEELFRKIHDLGFRTALVSNNEADRLERFTRNIDTLYIADADKPQIRGYKEALGLLNVDKEQAVYIGDQIFTDICGANKYGMPCILVHYIVVNEKEKIGKRRYLEKLILSFFRFRKSYHTLKDVIIKE